MKKSILTLIVIIFGLNTFLFGQVFRNKVRFDQSILKAKLVSSSESMDLYAAGNSGSNVKQADLPIFAVTLHDNMTYQSARQYIVHQRSYLSKEKKNIISEVIKDSIINGLQYYTLTMIAQEEGYNNIEHLVYGFVLKDNQAAFFLGSAKGSNVYVKRLQQTVLSLKIIDP